METNLRNSDTTHAPKFKSYYVVWKRVRALADDVLWYKFKSYYVVWKLPNKDNYSLLENTV